MISEYVSSGCINRRELSLMNIPQSLYANDIRTLRRGELFTLLSVKYTHSCTTHSYELIVSRKLREKTRISRLTDIRVLAVHSVLSQIQFLGRLWAFSLSRI